MALDTSLGYSLPIQFSDPATAKSTNLQGAGLRIGKAGKEPVSPMVIVHNAGQTTALLNGRVPYSTTDGTNGEIVLPQIELSPRETEVIDIAPYVKAKGLNGDVTGAGLEFEYAGELGSVVTSAFSVSRSSNQVFRVPLWDIAAQRSGTGGYPWYIEGDSSTVIYIKNVTDEIQKYRMYLKLSGGDYAFPLTTVSPHQTTVIDIRKLRDMPVPDVNGQIIPAGEKRGQLQWSLTGGVDRVVIGRSEQVDLVRGISSNYACQNCCPNSFFDGWLTPVQSTSFEGGQIQYIAMQQDANCYGQVYPAYQAGSPFYTSSDLSICNPNFNTGTTTGVGPGEAIINGGWTADAWFFGPFGVCDYTPEEVLREALCEVLAVRFLKASEPDTSNSADFNQFNSANLNTSSCGGFRFSIKATFQLPQFSAGCCNNPLTSFVKLSDDNKFEFAPLPDGTIYDFFGNDSPPHVIVYLRRRANNAGTTDSVRIVVGGSYQSGESYTGQGTVHPICQ